MNKLLEEEFNNLADNDWHTDVTVNSMLNWGPVKAWIDQNFISKKELIEKCEGFQNCHHKDNHERGCVNCVEWANNNKTLQFIINLIK